MYSHNNYNGIDPIIMSIICKKARNLIKSGYFRADQLEDLEQELLFDLLLKIEKYNPKKCSFYGFVKKSVNSKACNLIRNLASPYDLDLDIIVALELEPSSYIEFDVTSIDIERIIQHLPSDLKILCELLQIMNITEIIKVTGKSRRTIYKKLKLIRRIFAENDLDLF